jgi:hypothetical protein
MTGLRDGYEHVRRKLPMGAEMVDRYTKCVLTVIAAALVMIAVQQGMRPATAQGGGCGIVVEEACWVRTDSRAPIAVEIIGR